MNFLRVFVLSLLNYYNTQYLHPKTSFLYFIDINQRTIQSSYGSLIKTNVSDNNFLIKQSLLLTIKPYYHLHGIVLHCDLINNETIIEMKDYLLIGNIVLKHLPRYSLTLTNTLSKIYVNFLENNTKLIYKANCIVKTTLKTYNFSNVLLISPNEKPGKYKFTCYYENSQYSQSFFLYFNTLLFGNIQFIYEPKYKKYFTKLKNEVISTKFVHVKTGVIIASRCQLNYSNTIRRFTSKINLSFATVSDFYKFRCSFLNYTNPAEFVIFIHVGIVNLNIIPNDTRLWILPKNLTVACIPEPKELLEQFPNIQFQPYKYLTLIDMRKGFLSTETDKEDEYCVICNDNGNKFLYVEKCYDVATPQSLSSLIFYPEMSVFKYRHSIYINCMALLNNKYMKTFQSISLELINNGIKVAVNYNINKIFYNLRFLESNKYKALCILKINISKYYPIVQLQIEKYYFISDIEKVDVKIYPSYVSLLNVNTFTSDYFKCQLSVFYLNMNFTIKSYQKMMGTMYKHTCEVYLYSLKIIVLIMYVIIYNNTEFKVTITSNLTHNVYPCGAFVKFQCNVFPSYIRTRVPPPFFLVDDYNSNVIYWVHNIINLINTYSARHLKLFCQLPYKAVSLYQIQLIELLDKRDMSLSIIPQDRILFILENNDTIKCIRNPISFETDKTYTNYIYNINETNPQNERIFVGNSKVSYLERIITCKCYVYQQLSLEIKRFIIITKRSLVEISIKSEYGRVILYGNATIINCTISKPTSASNDTTIFYQWIAIYNILITRGPHLYVYKNTVTGEYKQRCIVSIGRTNIEKYFSLLVIKYTSIYINHYTTSNRSVFITVETIELWCRIAPIILESYLDSIIPQIFITNKKIRNYWPNNDKVLLKPPLPNTTIVFLCLMNISKIQFKHFFNISLIDINSLRTQFYPESLIVIRRPYDIIIYTCLLVPLSIHASKYFQYSISMVKGPDNLTIVNNSILSNPSNIDGLYIFTCFYDIKGRKINSHKIFVLLDVSLLRIDIVDADNTIYISNSEVNLIVFLPYPREIIIDKSLQISCRVIKVPSLLNYKRNTFYTVIGQEMGFYNYNCSFNVFGITIFVLFNTTIVDSNLFAIKFNDSHTVYEIGQTMLPVKCSIIPNYIQSLIPKTFEALENYSIFTIVNNSILSANQPFVAEMEYYFTCKIKLAKLCKTSTYIVTVINCSNLEIKLTPINRNVLIDQLVACEINDTVSPSTTYEYDILKFQHVGRPRTCRKTVKEMLSGFIRVGNGFKVGRVFANCIIEFICVVKHYSGLALITYRNFSFVRKIISNITVVFEPDKDKFFVDDIAVCVVIGKDNSLNLSKVATMTVTYGDPNAVVNNVFRVLKDSQGGLYKLKCDYTTIFDEIRTVSKEVYVFISPYRLWISKDEYRTEDIITCQSNGFPQTNYTYRWTFISGPTNFIWKFEAKLYFEQLSSFGYYNISCSLSLIYGDDDYYLEKLFTVKLGGYNKPLDYKYIEKVSYDWIIKIMLTWIIFYWMMFFGLARYCTLMKPMAFFNKIPVGKIIRKKYLINHYVVKSEPGTHITFNSLKAYILLISHYYIPLYEDEFLIDYNQNIFANPYTKDCSEENLLPLYNILSTFNVDEEKFSDLNSELKSYSVSKNQSFRLSTFTNSQKT